MESLIKIQDGVLECHGDWTIANVVTIEKDFKSITLTRSYKKIDAKNITEMDSAGALKLLRLVTILKLSGQTLEVTGLTGTQKSLFDMVFDARDKLNQPITLSKEPGFFYRIGEWAVDKVVQTSHFLAFIGEVFVTAIRSLRHPKSIQWNSVISSMETMGYQALPIVALMAFLIGIVLVYELYDQLQEYGADIFIVDITGVAILREFAPLITAVIIAGRTSTAFAAMIGTMKVNEEIDALRTMGLSPIARLALPRILGLMLALPFVVIWADIWGVFGSMVMTKFVTGINYHGFLLRFEEMVALKHFILGLIKTPVFALLIAMVGCFQGFEVGTSAESVGTKTTKAAVQAIFLIIVADAAFSILFSVLGY